MGRTEGRSPEDTKRQILDAAAAAVTRYGAGATLDQIAAAGAVSKGGLLYHYANKQALLVALGADLIQTFRQQVENARGSAAGPSSGGPGSLARAYLDVIFEESADLARSQQHIALIAHLMAVPGLADLAAADAERWRKDFREDGLSEAVVSVFVATTDGISSAPLWGSILDDTQLGVLRALLERLVDRPDLLDQPW